MGGTVGERIPRYDGLEHATGKTQFVDDFQLPGMLYTKALLSPHAHAQILNIDTSKAERLAGVGAVLTYRDVPCNRFGPFIKDQPVLADDYVRHKAQPVAAVAAVDEDTALEAVELITVDYEERSAIFDPLEAMKPDAPVIHEGGNVAPFGNWPCRRIRLGDVERGFGEADAIVEGVYTTQSVEHAYLEPRVALAVPEGRGRLTLYTVGGTIWAHLRQLSLILQMPESDIRMVGGVVGGSFGGKNDLAAEPVAALLALKSGKPVKWTWTREEEFLSSSTRHPWRMEFKDGVKKDGRIVARQVRTIQDSGAYALSGPQAMDKHCFIIRGSYRIPNFWADGYVVYTNKQPAAAMRGFGATQATHGCEVQMDKIARTLGMDPLELRLINALREGDAFSTGQRLQGVATVECLTAAAKAVGWEFPEELGRSSTEGKRESQ